MQLSKYVKIFPFTEKPAHLLLYSTKKASTILIGESILKSIEEGNLSAHNMEILSRLGFLVPDVIKEKENMLSHFNEVNKRIKRFNAMVVMNLDLALIMPVTS